MAPYSAPFGAEQFGDVQRRIVTMKTPSTRIRVRLPLKILFVCEGLLSGGQVDTLQSRAFQRCPFVLNVSIFINAPVVSGPSHGPRGLDIRGRVFPCGVDDAADATESVRSSWCADRTGIVTPDSCEESELLSVESCVLCLVDLVGDLRNTLHQQRRKLERQRRLSFCLDVPVDPLHLLRR